MINERSVEENILTKINQIVDEVQREGVTFDDHHIFPDIYFDKLVDNKLHTLTIDAYYGGESLGIETITKVIFHLAKACPSTALCAAMHYYTLGVLDSVLSPSLKHSVFQDMWENGQFTASFNQPNVTLLTKNQNYQNSTKIRIDRENDCFVLNGQKLIVSGITRFKYLPVYGYQEDAKTRFNTTAIMLTKDDPGVEVLDTWRLSGMRSTLSHNVVLRDVRVPLDRIIGREGYAIEDTMKSIYWSRATISAVYLGIAFAAIEYIKEVLKKKTDYITGRSAAFLPGNQFTVAEMLVQFETGYNTLFAFARAVDSQNQDSEKLFQSAAITKLYIDRIANETVKSAMNIEGAASLIEGSFLEKLYRDVKASSFHQPSEHLIKEMISKRYLGILPGKTRWV